MVKDIQSYDSSDTEAITLSEDEVMFPGLADLHTHHEYNMIPIWKRPEEIDNPWDNRFEWRWYEGYREAVKEPCKELKEKWNKVFEKGTGENVAYGDLLLYFAELQAVAGGSTILQEYSTINIPDSPEESEDILASVASEDEEEFYYPFMEAKQMLDASVKKTDLLLRSTGIPAELGIETADSSSIINSVVELFKPKGVKKITPYIDTSGWKIVDSKYNKKNNGIFWLML